jgi:pyridoxamine 5'-phosphate oxidase
MNELHESRANPNPFNQFQDWFEQAMKANLVEPTAVTLATISLTGKPTARVVLLKDFDEQGFVFYTNYASRKGQELAQTPWACLNFWWDKLAYQVRIEGSVSQVSAAESDEYFHSRLRGSQLGAWASPQSQVIADRKILEDRVEEFFHRFEGQQVPRPPHWGGYRLKPSEFEFWQGRESRLHDRLRYHLIHDNQWLIERLAP